LSIARAVSETLIDRDIEMGEAAGKSSLQVVEDLFLKIMHDDDLPAHIAPTARRVPRIDTPKKEEPKIPVMPTLKRGRKPGLTETQKDEVLEMYKSGISTTEIQTAYSIGAQTLYSLVHNAGLPLRGAPQAKEPASVPTPPVSPPPPAAAASVNGRASDLTEWVVTYTVTRTETTIVAAKSFNDAAATITDGDVISVAKKLP
jgi:hypothetical protein